MDPLETKFVKHMRKYRPNSVTARLASEVEHLRESLSRVARENIHQGIEDIKAGRTRTLSRDELDLED